MAKDKKGFLMYADYITIFAELSDKEAGRLIKHIFSYVNDKNPEAPDKITKLMFEPIKQQLKRDLVKYEGIKAKRSEAGKFGAEMKKKQNEANQANASFAYKKEANADFAEKNQANQAVTVNDNDNDNVTVNDNVINNNSLRENFFNDLPNSSYLETACRDLGVKKEVILLRVKDFRQVAKMDYRDMASFVEHFRNWYRLNTNKSLPAISGPKKLGA